MILTVSDNNADNLDTLFVKCPSFVYCCSFPFLKIIDLKIILYTGYVSYQYINCKYIFFQTLAYHFVISVTSLIKIFFKLKYHLSVYVVGFALFKKSLPTPSLHVISFSVY